MADAIKGMFVKDKTLHIVQGSDVWTLTAVEGKEPNQWPLTHFANHGMLEEFVISFSAEFPELVDASQIYGTQRDAAKAAISTVLTDGLMPAFEKLREIRQSIGQTVPMLNRRKLYEHFAEALWFGYKELFPKAVKCLGFDIGFLFQGDKDFEKGMAEFISKSPPLIMDLPELLRRQRANWQQGLCSFRNDYINHRNKDIAEFSAFYEPTTAEKLFDHVWRTMADLYPTLIEARFQPTLSIMRIPAEEKNPKNPRQWRLFMCAPAERA